MNGKTQNNQDKELKDIYGQITDGIQRITAALYRVTDLMSDKEPIKWTLRDTAMHLHDNVMSIRFIKDKGRLIEETMGNFFRIIKTLELVSIGVYVSNLNFEILKREYLNLKNFIEGKNKKITTGDIIAPMGEIKLPAPNKVRAPEESSALLGEMGGGNTAGKSLDPENRKDKIAVFLKAGGPKTVGEISAIFEGSVSTKATQRDLLDLARMGRVLAKGDKRWRTYESI